MIIRTSRYPTPEEIDAIVREARRERAQAIAGVFRGAARGLARMIAGGAPAGDHPLAAASAVSFTKERPMAETFWRTALASLPPHVQERYASLFEAAEEYEPVIEFVVTARGRAYRALARACRGMADALRNAALALDVAARRLTLTR